MARNRSVIEVLLTATDQISGKLRTAGSNLKKFQGSITAVSTGFLALRQVAGDVVQGLDALVGTAVRNSRELTALNQRLGINVEALQELRFVAEQNNVAFTQLTMGMQRATRRISEAAQGTGEAKAAIEELNLSARGLAQLAPEDQFERLADALAGVDDQSDRVRLAFKFFDSEGVSILQAIGDGAEDVRRLREEFSELGAVMSEDTVRAMDETGRKIGRLQARWQGFANSVAELTVEILSDWEELASFDFSEKMRPVEVLTFFALTGLNLEELELDIEQAKAFADELAALRKKFGVDREVPTGLKAAEAEARAFMASQEFAAFGAMLAKRPTRDQPTIRGRVEFDAPKLEAPEEVVVTGVDEAGRLVFELQKVPPVVRAINEEMATAGEYTYEVRTATDAWNEGMAEVEAMAKSLGWTMVDLALSFGDAMANGLARAIVEQRKFNEITKQLWKQFATAAIAEITRVIARLLILEAVKLVASGGKSAISLPVGGESGEVYAKAHAARQSSAFDFNGGRGDGAAAGSHSGSVVDFGSPRGGAVSINMAIRSDLPPSRAGLLDIAETMGGALRELGFSGA